MITGDPIQSNGAIIRHTQALAAELNLGGNPKEGSKNSLQMAIGPNYREFLIGFVQVLESREEPIATSADDLQRRMGANDSLRRNLRHDDESGGRMGGAASVIGY